MIAYRLPVSQAVLDHRNKRLLKTLDNKYCIKMFVFLRFCNNRRSNNKIKIKILKIVMPAYTVFLDFNTLKYLGLNPCSLRWKAPVFLEWNFRTKPNVFQQLRTTLSNPRCKNSKYKESWGNTLSKPYKAEAKGGLVNVT